MVGGISGCLVCIAFVTVLLRLHKKRNRRAANNNSITNNNSSDRQATAVAVPMPRERTLPMPMPMPTVMGQVLPVNVEMVTQQNPEYMRRTRSDYFGPNTNDSGTEEDRRALFHVVDNFRQQEYGAVETIPRILQGMHNIQDMFDPPDIVIAAFRTKPEVMDALAQELVDISMRKMNMLGEAAWARDIAPTFGAMMRAVKAAQARIILGLGNGDTRRF